MPFLRWFAREGFRTLKYVFRGIFRSLLRYVPCTMHPPLFSHPLRVNGMAGVSLAPMPPGIALKTAAARYAPLRLHLADRAGLPPLSRPALWPPYSSHPWDSPSGATLTLFKNAPGVFTLKTGPGCAPAFSSRGRHVAISLQKVFQRRNGQHGISKKNAGHLSVTRISPQATF
ncbi:Uncharacterised protein [Raoultella ornithinolytica]|nr:Uncharacterised protein [Raoultella ornithinolytica]